MSASVWLDEQPPVPLPRYGTGALSDLMPSIAASLGMPGEENTLGLAPARAACVFLIDGLGWDLLREHPVEAPYLHSLLETSFAGSGRPLTAASRRPPRPASRRSAPGSPRVYTAWSATRWRCPARTG